MITLLEDSLLVWLKLLLPGMSWVWVLPRRLLTSEHPLKQRLCAGAGAVIVGILLTALTTLTLGELGLFTPRIGWTVWLILVFSGFGTGLMIYGRPVFRLYIQTLPLCAVALVGIGVIMACPNRGEWLAGGWDPGVYMNESAALERTGTFYPPDTFFYELFTPKEQKAVTPRTFSRGTERFNGVLTHPEKKSFLFEFFRLTPSLFAAINRAGGLGAMTRSNTIIGMMVLFCFAAFAWKNFGFPHAIFSTFLVAAQPIFLYHTHFPTAEMLHLFLIIALLYVLINQPPTPRTTILAFLLLSAAVLNRFSFLPFAGILLFCLAIAEIADNDRGAILVRRLALIIACVSSAALNTVIAPASLDGWAGSTLNVMLSTAGAAFLGALLVDCLACSKTIRSRMQRLPSYAMNILGISFLLLVLVSWLFREHIGKIDDLDNLIRLIPFCGWLPMLCAGLGMLAVLFLRPRLTPQLLAVIMFFFLVCWLLILKKYIVDLYPWATRRYLPYLIPFIALSAGYVPARLWQIRKYPQAGKTLALIVFLFLLAVPAKTSWQAWNATHYDGLGETLALVADQIGPHDIVIADHSLWGTPLALILGKNVLDGRGLWEDKTEKRMASMLPALNRLSKQGKRIRFLTSTKKGMSIYPMVQDQARLDWTGPEATFRGAVQHPRAKGFHQWKQDVIFRLFTWQPDQNSLNSPVAQDTFGPVNGVTLPHPAS